MSKEGKKIFELIKKLFPINRSLTGEGNRKTLNIIKENLKNFGRPNFTQVNLSQEKKYSIGLFHQNGMLRKLTFQTLQIKK